MCIALQMVEDDGKSDSLIIVYMQDMDTSAMQGKLFGPRNIPRL